MRKLFFLCSVLAVGLLNASVVAAASWPTSSGVNISSALSAMLPPSGHTFEPSDATWVNGRLLLVSDEGDVATMDAQGNNLDEWVARLGADFEGVAVVGDTIYLLNEGGRVVYAYSLTSHERLARYDIAPWIPGSDNSGPEALAVVDGLLYVGHQVTGTIHVFDVTSGTPSLVRTWESGIGLTALSLAYDGKLYALGSGMLRVFSHEQVVAEYWLPSGLVKPEGVALDVHCATGVATMFIADDTGPVYRYDDFPVSCSTTTPIIPPEPEPEPIVFSSAVGSSNGSIIVTYSDGSSLTYDVYDMKTRCTTAVYQYKDSQYLVVTGPYGGRIAVVDADTGTTIAMRSTPTRQSILAAWLVSVIGY